MRHQESQNRLSDIDMLGKIEGLLAFTESAPVLA